MRDFYTRAMTLLSWRRIWGLGLTALGLLGQAIHWGWVAADYLGRMDVFWRVVETMGGTPAMIAALISSWQFSLVLIVLGLGYTVFVGEPEKGTQRHHWWPYIAASVFFICLAAMGSVAIYGAVELALRRAYDEGRTGVSRGTPDESSPSRPQKPLFSNNSRDLTPDQIRILLVEFSKITEAVKAVPILTVNLDNETYNLYRQFSDVFQRAGINAGYAGAAVPFGLDDIGFSIRVPNANNVPISAERLIEAFEVANIHLRISEWTNMSQEFVLFIGPRPIL
jgi:hypothetical protein